MTLFKISNDAKHYDWGSKYLIPALMRTDSNGQPQAEIWLGTHPSDPSEVLDPIGGTLLERVGELPFLVKFLAAAKPLSIQAHPSRARAQIQYAAGHPSYQDANHKPELIVAVSDFEALCGFRAEQEVTADLGALARDHEVFSPWLASFQAGGLTAATAWAFQADEAVIGALVSEREILGPERAKLIEVMAEHFGFDAGILVSVLMNYVTLKPGQALFLPAGNIHSYLSGLGVEVMAASDNVLRGGLSKKPIDIAELMEVLDFKSLDEPMIETRSLGQGLVEYPVSCDDFSVYQVSPSGQQMLVDIELHGASIIACVAGELTVSNSLDEMVQLAPGEAAFMRAAKYFSVTGSGTGYLAMG
ncbi:MAG: mannose-6-phosphate isomerase, class I [Aquiluna sp.]|nr:mannose-6-phosphate isomerase, class I [Aquiluna sp.]